LVRQSDYTPVPLKTHLIAVHPEVSRQPLCVVDADRFNHLPHQATSVFGMDRWLPVAKTKDVSIVDTEIDRLWEHIERFFPSLNQEDFEIKEWAGTIIQAMYADQVDPGRAPRPAVIDHQTEPSRIDNLLSVFPGRATLWPHLAEQTRQMVLERIDTREKIITKPPWA
jgi:glycerol-3-phosphate dehydrogenase